MAQLEDLLSRVEDPELRRLLEAEVRQLKARIDFGLVFERHLPESVLLGSTGVHVGDTVRLRRQPDERRELTVLAVDGDSATLGDGESGEEAAPVGDLLVVKEFDDPVFPTLRSVESVERGEPRDPHLVIESENFHALQLLRFTHRKQFDCIYIDPPYNTGARDWKYNNAFVDDNDGYRHSKWLSFMEKRLRLAKELLRPDGVLIVTIDVNELNHLGVLLERKELFADAIRQIITICTNPSGAAGEGLSRVDEYAVFCFLGDARPAPTTDDMLTQEGSEGESAVHGVSWERLMRRGNAWYRASRPNLCYPVILNEDSTRIVRAGERWEPPINDDGNADESARPDTIDGHPVAWPVRSDGKLGIWRVQPKRLNWLVERGYAYVSTRQTGRAPTLRYLLEGTVEDVESGAIRVVGRGDRGQILVEAAADTNKVAKTVWHRGRHTAGGSGGTLMLNALLGERNIFSFPKSVYATRDCLEIAIGHRADALILDFFAGSGTTLHATCLLNAADGGRRRCYLVTNNEVTEERAKQLNAQELFVGDDAYERHGIFRAATRPRVKASITGIRPDGQPTTGSYLDGRATADGFEESVEFARLEHLNPERVELGLAISDLAPMAWLLAGARGPMPETFPADEPFVVNIDGGYAVLLDDTAFGQFIDAVGDREDLSHIFIVTDYDDAFAVMSRELPSRAPLMLPRDYLNWFRRHTGATR